MKPTLSPGCGPDEPMNVIGLMSGTSCDGVDAALCEIEDKEGGGVRFRLLGEITEPYSQPLRKLILKVSEENWGNAQELCRLNFRIGEAFARAALHLLKKAGVAPEAVDLIGSHGQTVAHQPPQMEAKEMTFTARRTGSSLQLGEPAVIAERTGIPVVSNFRARDVAAGGQGAPLVPYVDVLLLSNPHLTRAAINIGGISNLTFLPAGGTPSAVLAFDAGPGNMICDALVSRMTMGKKGYDEGGALARTGRRNAFLFAELAKHPFLALPPPKSTGREAFGKSFSDRLYQTGIQRDIKPADILRTAAEFTAFALGEAYRKFLAPRGTLHEAIVSGGGAFNEVIMERLAAEWAPVKIRRSDELGIPAGAKEAISFAILAREMVLGRPANLPSATGAKGPRILGQFTPAGTVLAKAQIDPHN